MEGKLIENIRLENGLILEIFDHSRHVAGDRWLVSLEARIEVEVKPDYFTDHYTLNMSFENIRAVVGEKTTYSYKKERHFIGEKEKDELLNGLKVRFLETNLGYLSSPEFPLKLILRRYHEAYSRTFLRKER